MCVVKNKIKKKWFKKKISAKIWVCNSGQNLKMTKTSYFCSIHQENTCIILYWIWSSWLTSTVLQWNKTNFKISQFSRFLLRSRYAILVKIWKGLKLLNSVLFIKKTLANHLYIPIRSSWLTFTVLQSMKKNFIRSQFSKISAQVRVCDSDLNLKMTKTS